MKKHHGELGSRRRSYDEGTEAPDPYDDFPEGIEALLDGAGGEPNQHHRSRRRR